MKIFNETGHHGVKSSKFDLSHERKMSLKMGKLYPIYLEEVIPGDKFRMNSQIFMRLAPMISPVMHRINVYTHSFFVPYRLVNSGWEDFITGGEDGLDTTNSPKLSLTTSQSALLRKGSLSDYFGIPVCSPTQNIIAPKSLNAMPFRAYQMIYNEYYRDQNLEQKIEFNITPDNVVAVAEMNRLMTLRDRAWEKDYFTSALPNTQKGAEIKMPIGTFTPEYSTYSSFAPDDPGVDEGVVSATASTGLLSVPTSNIQIQNLESEIEIDGANTINDLRRAVRLQEWLEKNARGGSRYTESIKAHFGVRSSDQRLQRPEYLGGSRQPVVISEVLNTSDTASAVQGEMAGHGVSAGSGNNFSRSFEEHGMIITIMSVLPKTSYQQGLERIWFKTDKFEYAWPEFANIGEQEVYSKELYHDWHAGDEAGNNDTFGFQSRYCEYKYRNSTVHGDFRDNLAFWHMSRDFATRPVLNNDFVKSDPTDRIFAVQDGTDTMYAQIFHKISAIRKLPYLGIPEL